jgi:hypothetical protein
MSILLFYFIIGFFIPVLFMIVVGIPEMIRAFHHVPHHHHHHHPRHAA